MGGPCGPGREVCTPGPFPPGTAPAYHVMDASCGENDSVAPFYDPLHNLYHLFYESHLAEPTGRGPVYGHAVSADLAFWARLPVAIWNDQPYDSSAIFTGSATLVDGTPNIVYPGICTKAAWPACSTGVVNALAVPANRSDPLLAQWAKPAFNPIVENAVKDTTSAWRTAAGEWRFSDAAGRVLSSADFKTWAPVGAVKGWGGDCSDFFELPPFCSGLPGCAPAGANATLPTHVFKNSGSGGISCPGADCYWLGRYDEGAPNTTGAWAPLPGVKAQPLDFTRGGYLYASKSFWDPAKGRRVYFAWANVPPASCQTLPRAATYHAGLQRLLLNPVPELAALRAGALFSAPAVPLPGGGAVWLGDWPPGAGNQSEVAATFDLPAGGAASFGLRVLAGRNASGANVSTPVVLHWAPSPPSLNVTVGGAAPLGLCDIPYGCTTAPVPLLAGEASMDVRVFVDNTFIEVFVGGGRLAFTAGVQAGAAAGAAGAALFAEGGGGAARNVSVWQLSSAWKQPADILRQRAGRG